MACHLLEPHETLDLVTLTARPGILLAAFETYAEHSIEIPISSLNGSLMNILICQMETDSDRFSKPLSWERNDVLP